MQKPKSPRVHTETAEVYHELDAALIYLYGVIKFILKDSRTNKIRRLKRGTIYVRPLGLELVAFGRV